MHFQTKDFFLFISVSQETFFLPTRPPPNHPLILMQSNQAKETKPQNSSYDDVMNTLNPGTEKLFLSLM